MGKTEVTYERWIAAGILILAMTGCSRYEPAKEMTRAQEESVQSEASGAQNGQETQEAEAADSQVITISTYPPRNPVKVKGHLCIRLCGRYR